MHEHGRNENCEQKRNHSTTKEILKLINTQEKERQSFSYETRPTIVKAGSGSKRQTGCDGI